MCLSYLACAHKNNNKMPLRGLKTRSFPDLSFLSILSMLLLLFSLRGEVQKGVMEQDSFAHLSATDQMTKKKPTATRSQGELRLGARNGLAQVQVK